MPRQPGAHDEQFSAPCSRSNASVALACFACIQYGFPALSLYDAVEARAGTPTGTMSTLEFFPKRTFSMRRYTLTRDGVEIGQIDCGGARQPATLTISGTTYNPVSEGGQRTKLHLDGGGARIAEAKSAGTLFRRFIVRIGAKTYTLKVASWLGRIFVLTENDVEIGRIARTGFLTARSRAELPDDLPLPLQAFLIWLVLTTWRRQAMVTGVVAGGAAAGS
jgi:hypothetical protein